MATELKEDIVDEISLFKDQIELYKSGEFTDIYFFKSSEQYIVVEENYIIEISNSKERADSLIPLFEEGDYVDILGDDEYNVKIVEIGRTMENDLYFELDGKPYNSYDYDELTPSLNPPSD